MAESRILAIIQREKDRSQWKRINCAMEKERGRSVGEVDVQREDGTIVTHNTESEVQETIWNEIHRKRFYAAERASICQGKMREDFGYTAVSPAAEAVLQGNYEYEEDADEYTRELLDECARIRAKVPRNSVNSLITRETWQTKWRRAKEDTSSSESGLHFGHYKAGAESDLISHFHAMKTSLVLKHGIALKRWARGLSVMCVCVLTSVAGAAPLARSALLAYPGFSQSPKGLGSTQTRSVAPQQLGAWAVAEQSNIVMIIV